MTKNNTTYPKLQLQTLLREHENLISRPNELSERHNGIVIRYKHPVITKNHIPLSWRYDFNPETNPFFMERIGVNSTLNSGAIKWKGKYVLLVRVEGVNRKSFFAIAESPNGIDRFRFWERPLSIPDISPEETNIYDIRLTEHEDGWVYGIFCSERRHPEASTGDYSRALASAGIIRTKDLIHWERLPDIKASGQQRNVVLHPEFVNGKYALYTRPQDDFILAGSGGGIGWSLVDDITNAVIRTEKIINHRQYHTIKELKNGEGPPPIKTTRGWLHLAHGVRSCASGLRYVLYLYMTSLEDPSELIAEPGGFFLAPADMERVGDVFNILFSNGWILDDNGTVLIYYASSDTRMHVAGSTVDRLVDYCLNTPPDGLRSVDSVEQINNLIDKNKIYLSKL